MDFLFVLVGSAGDVLPGLAIARRLVELGHQAWVLTNGHFKKTVEGQGVNFLENGTAEDYHRLTLHPDLWKPFKGTRLLLSDPQFGRVHEEQLRITREWIDQRNQGEFGVLGSTLAIGSRLLRSARSFPLVSLHLSPIAFRSLENPPQLTMRGGVMGWLHHTFPRFFRNSVDRWILDPVLESQLGKLRKVLGVPPIRGWFTDWLHSPDLVMAPFPQWFATASDYPKQTRQYDFPLCGNDAPLPVSIQEFFDNWDPPVVATLGSAMAQAERVFAAIGKAARNLGKRVLFLTQHPEQISQKSDRDLVAPWAPLGPVFGKGCLIVHHGGIGTTAQALASGRPQLIFPFAHDQADNGAKLEALGCGIMHDPHSIRFQQLLAQMGSLWEAPARQEACKTVALRLAPGNGVQEMAQDFVQLVGGFVKGWKKN